MKTCCTKLVDGTACPSCATREITLQARGLVFKVPICEQHFKMMPAAPKEQRKSSFSDLIDQAAREYREGRR